MKLDSKGGIMVPNPEYGSLHARTCIERCEEGYALKVRSNGEVLAWAPKRLYAEVLQEALATLKNQIILDT